MQRLRQQLKRILSSRQQRLTLATVGAITLHTLLFVSGFLVIKQISIPSNENRVMVLTLDSTPTDGLSEPTTEVIETINEAKLGEAASMPKEPHPNELSQLTTLPHQKATFELDPKPQFEPTPEIETVTQTVKNALTEPQVLTQVTPSEPSILELLDMQNSSPFTIDIFANDYADDFLLTSPNSDISISSEPAKAQTKPAQNHQIEPKQRKMLEKKVQRWAQEVANREEVNQDFSWQHKGQTYSANFTHIPASGDMDLDEMVVEVATVENGQALTTTMRMKKLAFSNFAQFVHRWDPRVMIHDDEMKGRFHSNSQILLASDRRTRPVFHGKVTTASYSVDFDDSVRRSTRREIFKGGLETGVKRIRMPKPRMMFKESSPRSDKDTITYDKDTRLVFTADGGVMSYLAQEEGAPRYQKLPSHPMYLVAAPGVTLFVSGEVTGKIMVYSPERIVIESDLIYARPDFATTSDVVGLISGKDVVIAGQAITGSGDLNIQASIYAKRRFHVRDYAKAHTGTLRIIGSVSAGSVSATQPRYATSITFDKRFETLKPPGFPVTDRYEVTEAKWEWE